MFKTPPKNLNINDVIKNVEKIHEAFINKENPQNNKIQEIDKKDKKKKIRVVDIYNDNIPWET